MVGHASKSEFDVRPESGAAQEARLTDSASEKSLLGVQRRSLEDVVPDIVGHTVADVERELILQTLKECQGNRTSAASVLGISVRTMRNKLRLFQADGTLIPSCMIRY